MGLIYQGLDAEAYDRSYGDSVLLRRILQYFRPHAKKMLSVSGLVALSSISQTILPIVVAQGVDMLVTQPAVWLLLLLSGIAFLLGIVNWVFNFFRQRLSAEAVGDVVLALRKDAFDAVMKRDLSFYDQFSSGKIVSRVTSDTQDFATVVTLSIDVGSQLLLAFTITGVLFFIEPGLALVTLLIAPAFLVAALSFRRIARWTSQRAQRMIARVNATIQESISGIAVAKGFRREAAIYKDFEETNKVSYNVRLQQGLVLNTIFPVLDFLAGAVTAVVIYVGGRDVLRGDISIGDWYLFVRSLMIYYIPLIGISSFWSQFQQGLAASERVFALIDAEPKVVQIDNQSVPSLQGWIALRNIDFSYKENEPVLQNFTINIPAGLKLAVVGHTGAGKSSLVRLVTRFYEFQGGGIFVDGRDIRRINLADYRKHIGLVPQIPFLFSGTVAENIRYGKPEASEEEVQQAAMAIGEGEWVEDLPQGLQTNVGERGGSLSLGQRQLVALARVLLQNPSVFILDEATASIDPFTEAQIQEGLDTIMRCRTSIIIAHRLSTVKSADRIIVMQRGQIIEEGTHDELLLKGGNYADLYNTYFRHQSAEYIEQVGAW
jgi:ABC-type multidrug transport system fused ATPase/permease subunit